MAGKIILQLVALVIPGAGAIVVEVVDSVTQLIVFLATAAKDMRDSKAMCNQVIERIVSLCKHIDGMQDTSVLEHNNVLPKLAMTIKNFHAVMIKHCSKGTIMQFVARHNIVAKIAAFHGALDEISLLLQLTTVDEITQIRREFHDKRAEDAKVSAELLANTRALINEYSGRNFREVLLDVQAAIKKNNEAASNAQLFTRADIQLLQRTMNAMVAHSGTQIPELQPWYIPSSTIKCPVEHFAIGSYGSVHRGTCNGARVVIKKLLMAADDAVERDFHREVAVWYAINDYKHVLRLYGACHASTPPFFVCEDATDGNFVEYFAVASNKTRFLWRRFYEAALGLAHLHSKKVVHGDLKGRNLLVGADGETKVCDFGFSFIRSESKALSVQAQTDAIRWKALECINGEEHTRENPQFKSDVYSLGMCIIEVVSGVEPWEYLNVSGNSQELEDKIYDALNNQVRHPRPVGFTDDQWKLVNGMTSIDKLARMPLDEVLSVLKCFASIEEISQKLASTTLLVCSKCSITYNSPVNFCSACGSSLRASHAAEPDLPSTVAPSLLAPTATA